MRVDRLIHPFRLWPRPPSLVLVEFECGHWEWAPNTKYRMKRVEFECGHWEWAPNTKYRMKRPDRMKRCDECWFKPPGWS